MQITINIPDAQVSRVADMVRGKMPREDLDNQPITYTDAELLAEFKRQIRRWIKGEVQQHELLKQHKQIFESYSQIEVTE